MVLTDDGPLMDRNMSSCQ